MNFNHPLMWGVYIAIFVICSTLAFVFLARNMVKSLLWLCAILYVLISVIFMDMLWQMSITSIIVLAIALVVGVSKNTYSVFRRYMIYSVVLIILNFVMKWFLLYYHIELTDPIDNIGTCCFDLVSICLCLEIIYTSFRFPINNEWEDNNRDLLDKLKEFSFYSKLTSFYKLNYKVARCMRHSLSISDINAYYKMIRCYVDDNRDKLVKMEKEELLSSIFSVYKVDITSLDNI